MHHSQRYRDDGYIPEFDPYGYSPFDPKFDGGRVEYF